MTKEDTTGASSNEFQLFEGLFKRAGDLERVPRYSALEMIHRTDLRLHTTRTVPLVDDVAQVLRGLGITIDKDKAKVLLSLHDDPEVITGDIPSPVKLVMNDAEKAALDEKERQATIALSERYFPGKLQEQYVEYAREVQEKQTVEAQAVDIVDKWDGLCETLHELRCGNNVFLKPLENYRSLVIPRLQRHQIWEPVSTHPDIQLQRIPTIEDAHAFPKISIDTYTNYGAEAFWRQVMDPNVPEFYKRWVNCTLFGGINPYKGAASLFPGWKEQLREQSPEIYLPLKYKAQQLNL
jgi:5'-deoxynucleotidase YfbR-like HD superfamily hydrolase